MAIVTEIQPGGQVIIGDIVITAQRKSKIVIETPKGVKVRFKKPDPGQNLSPEAQQKQADAKVRGIK